MDTTIFSKLDALCSPRHKAAAGTGLPDIAEIQRREVVLKEVALILKAEFAGLDEQIDQIMTLVRPWYVLPQAQRRPTVVNLWGMTGVGKSSFIRRLVECLDAVPQFAYIDLGKAVDGASTRMDSIANFPTTMTRLSGEPCILFFDEMHGVRTVDDMGRDIDRPQLCDFWTLIDSGLVPQAIEPLINALNGISREFRFLTEQEMSAGQGFIQNAGFADEYHLDQLIILMELKTTTRELRELALTDAGGFLSWTARKLEQQIKTIPPLDFTQALIFTAGNLDEVYGDSFSLNPDDMNAEDLYRRTSQVVPDKVKQVLLRRFRPEQVARLGSLQVLFPSLSKNAFLRLIRIRLDSLSAWMKKNFHVDLTFDETVVNMLMHEGVVPAQGARPVLSTITELIEIRTPTWLIAASERGVKSLSVHYDKASQAIECSSGEILLHAGKIKRREEKLPQVPISEAMRYVITVHEAGHTVAGIVGEGRLPIKILTGSMAWHRGGPRVEFPPADVLTRECAMTFLTTALAGMAAEQIVFGDENFSMGCCSDLQKATDLAGSMVAQCAMGSHIAVSLMDQAHPTNLASVKDADDRQVEILMETALSNARKIIQAQRPLLNAVIEQLQSNERVTRKDIAETVKRHYKGSKKEVAAILERQQPRDLENLMPRRLKKAS